MVVVAALLVVLYKTYYYHKQAHIIIPLTSRLHLSTQDHWHHKPCEVPPTPDAANIMRLEQPNVKFSRNSDRLNLLRGRASQRSASACHGAIAVAQPGRLTLPQPYKKTHTKLDPRQGLCRKPGTGGPAETWPNQISHSQMRLAKEPFAMRGLNSRNNQACRLLWLNLVNTKFAVRGLVVKF